MQHELRSGPKSIFKIAVFGLIFSISTNAFAVPKYIPVVNGQFAIGQWYFQGSKSALGGNAALRFVPAIQYTNKFSLLPSFNTNYRGTRSAEELAGGSKLFQDTWENGISVKGVHGLAKNWRVRENVGVRMKWFRETTDETWNKGLYDYRVYNGGAEAEYLWNKDLTMSFGYDLSFVKFPNYTSLESSQSSDLSREFSGSHPLDTNIHLFSTRIKAPLLWGVNSQTQLYFSPRSYSDQTVVVNTGLLSSEKRRDDYTGANFSVDRALPINSITSLGLSLFYGYGALNSNQNHYDARLTTFIPDYYDYDQSRMGTQILVGIKGAASGPMVFDVGYSLSRRDYRSRVIQSNAGNYLSEKLYTEESELVFGFSYPLSKNFKLQVSSTFGHSKSNNQYETVYRYNYSNSNYLFGFTYEY